MKHPTSENVSMWFFTTAKLLNIGLVTLIKSIDSRTKAETTIESPRII